MYTDYQRIRDAIEQVLVLEKRNFIIYPYGEYGVIAKKILNDSFGIKEDYIIDNKLSQFNSNIKSLNFCKDLDKNKFTVLFTCANPDVYDEVLYNLKQYFTEDNIIEIFENLKKEDKSEHQKETKWGTKCGKHTYGPLRDHWLVKSTGAFCSFAPGTDVVDNHAIEYISTHTFIYYGRQNNKIFEREWNELRGGIEYIDGIIPKGNTYKLKKITIGNDVWLGKNVLITNSSNIGNGVIAGAGAVITKDVPDYAVVVGVPARIIKYRYTPMEIEALNRIAWWDWSDEKIKENYDDFYLNIKDFILKYDIK